MHHEQNPHRDVGQRVMRAGTQPRYDSGRRASVPRITQPFSTRRVPLDDMATKSRSRKSKASDTAPTQTDLQSPAVEAGSERVTPSDDKNVSPFEGTLSIYAGALLLVAALFPRSFKQVLLLGLGAGFIYRGQSRHCHVYSAVGVDTNKTGLIKQLSNTLFS